MFQNQSLSLATAGVILLFLFADQETAIISPKLL